MEVRHFWFKQQNGGNEGSRVSNTDPPNKINNWERPPDRLVCSPNANTLCNEPDDGDQQHLHHHERNSKAKEPMKRRLFLQRQITDLVSNSRERMVALDHRRMKFLLKFFIVLHKS